MCGIFSWSSIDKKNWTPLNKFKFEVLGVEMDSRGGDGCGIAYDNTVVKSIEHKKFDDFWRTDYVPDELEYPIIIGHDRRASIGAKTIDNTQPICFDFKENQIYSRLAHNGTIYNHKELYEKHKLEAHYSETDIQTMSDSQVLCILLERVGWSILEEYIGSAAIMYSDPRTPSQFYVYHGSSPTRKHGVESEERPLYYAIDGDDIWFCSTRAALEKIISDKSKIREVPFNIVYRVSGNTMTEVCTVNRKNSFQMEELKTYTTKSKSLYDEYDSYDDAYDSYRNYGGYGGLRNDNFKAKALPAVSNANSSDKFSDDRAYGRYDSIIFWEAGLFRLITGGKADKSEIVDGAVSMNYAGKVMSMGQLAAMGHGFNLYFWKGNLCKGPEEYKTCLVTAEELGDKVSDKKLYKILGCNFVFPFIVPSFKGGDDNKVYSSSSIRYDRVNGQKYPICDMPYSGAINPPGRACRLTFTNGKFNGIYTANYLALSTLQAYSDDNPEKFNKWLKDFAAYKGKNNAGHKMDELYVCPDCEGVGFIAHNKDCPLCDGSGSISTKDIDTEISYLEMEIERLCVEGEESKYIAVISDIIEDGIATFEEPSIMEKSTFLLEKLKEIKTIISR